MKSRSTPRAQPQIVIAEDDEAIARNVADALRGLGYRTHWSKDGLDAINRIFKSKPSAIILDVSLPKLSGTKICRMVRDTRELSATPIIVISGHSATTDKMQLFALGADDYLTKPFSVDELIARLHAVIGRSLFLRPHVLVPTHLYR
jgi:DNA-binding response OmpR family regulator